VNWGCFQLYYNTMVFSMKRNNCSKIIINCRVILLLKRFRNLESGFSICSGISGILNQNLGFMSVVSFPVQEG
jgi:hypothetical protein